jgi:glycosyltransferase involved in cell wall biosynthesis
MKPLVSILIPSYNAQRWIADTLRSALSQTWEQKEIILVDDGSQDETVSIARKFEPQGVRIVVQKNQGSSAARNTAFSLSQGDYIQWLDHDDLMEPHKIERQVQVLSSGSKRTLFSGQWGSFMFSRKRAEFVETPLWRDLTPTEFLLRKMGENLFMQTSVWLVSRELSEAAGPWDTKMLTDDDGEYFCRVLLASDGIRFVPGAKTYWRRSGTAQGSYLGRAQKKLEAQWCSMKLHIGYLRSLEDSPRVRAACLAYLQNWMPVFYPEKINIFLDAQQMAEALGGNIDVPRLSWKYEWVRVLFGWGLARRAQLFLPSVKSSAIRFWDRLLFHLDDPYQVV